MPAIRSSRFDLPLTYDAGDLELQVGDVVRVPLGSREVLAFVLAEPQSGECAQPLRAVIGKTGAPRAFTPLGLALAAFVARRYLCTLGEALSAVVLAAAVPRTVDTFAPTVPRPNPARYPSVPGRLVRLVWENLREGFTLDQLLRHPEARRAGDRASLLRYVSAMVRSGEIRRERRFMDARTHEFRINALYPGEGKIAGPKARALVEFVTAQPGVPRADALLAGFSNAVIARAIAAGAIRQMALRPPHASASGVPAPAPYPPTAEQARVVTELAERLDAGGFSEVLLRGVTGSGKTFVYIEAIKHAVRGGGRAIVLVPEISLTPQTARRFESAFGQRIAVLHSALSERERFDAWQACARGEVDVVVGARSAVFAPLEGVRLLVVDESHEQSYKQDSTPRYHAVHVARERMRLENGVLLLGSATPSLESYADALAGRIALQEMHERATRQGLPEVHVVDMAREFESGNRRIFSTRLSQALDGCIARGEKAVLFVNRRGSAGFMLCRACGKVPECDRCSVALTVHRAEGLLRCHYCDAQRPLAAVCPSCAAAAVREFGVGTQRVAEEVERLYPAARVIRMDGDTTTRVGDHARLLDAFAQCGDVLVGTQMVAKGLDFPTVTLVGVVAADIGLHAPDFRAAERSFGVITQVCGRSGRSRPGEAIVQTYAPAHPAIAYAARHDYVGFAREELAARGELGYPPWSELLYLGVIGRRRAQALAQARLYAQALEKSGAGEVLGPAPYAIARMNDEWRFRLAFKGRDGQALRDAVQRLVLPAARADRANRLVVNVDP